MIKKIFSLENKIYAGILLLIFLVIFIFGMDVFGVGFFDKTIQIEITENDNLTVISKKLQKEDVILSSVVFKLFYKCTTYPDIIHPGTITVSKNDSYLELAREINNPNTNYLKITIPEGFEVREIIERLQNNHLITNEEEFKNALKSYRFTTSQGSEISGETALLSGFLYPDTYEMSPDITMHEIIQMLTDNFKAKWTDKYQKQADKLHMSVNEVITLASIVEREAGKDEDFPLVASVFHNRLKIGKNLESCATVQYVLKERKPVLSVSDTKIDSPYNTYRNKGLPPAPIASPGQMAIEAVLYPKETDYLYFFTDKNGTNHYSKTYEEHNQLIEEFGL
ncbi:MAG: endolytic transglycosylase MltG [Clostridia bacterium]|nr:endolytic transglycosylase MltG [Clostridia bacterium]